MSVVMIYRSMQPAVSEWSVRR